MVRYGHIRNLWRGRNTKGFWDARGEDLDESGHIMAELPQPWPMTLVDVKLWILKLFRLHPETQDLQIKGFFKEFCPDFFDIGLDDHGPEFYSDNLDWEERLFHSDRSWTSFVNKMKREKSVSAAHAVC